MNTNPVSPESTHQHLAGILRSSDVHFRPARRGYRRGEEIERSVYGLDGGYQGTSRFWIEHSPGSGFAGQVYRAVVETHANTDDRATDWTSPIAIKILRPRNRWKEAFRDLLFRLSYQAPYAPRLCEEALRCGLIWQALLCIAGQIEFDGAAVIARPLGYYWDDELASFAEIHEWIDGRAAVYQADPHMVSRWLRREPISPDSEMRRKRAFMDRLAALCREIGAIGLARQYEWYTFVSQANVLTRQGISTGLAEFVAVDCRPGLAVPFFLPLSPVHARIILDGLRRGSFAHFDEVDFSRLDAYVAAHAEAFRKAAGLIQQLKQDDACYRQGLPDLWHTRTLLLKDEKRKKAIKIAVIEDWRKTNMISPIEAMRIMNSSLRFLFSLVLCGIPIVGHPLLRLQAHEGYRQHLGQIIRRSGYRRAALDAMRATDLLTWQDEGRIAADRLTMLHGSMSHYLVEKLTLSWQPSAVHRFLTDPAARRALARSLIVNNIHLCLDRRYRECWLNAVIDEGAAKGVIDLEATALLRRQIGEARMESYVRDFAVAIGLDFVAKVFYLGLAAYGFSTRDFLPLAITALGPISPSGLVRAAYVLAQLAVDAPYIVRNRDGRLLLSRLLGLVTAPWRGLGNLFAPLEMFAYYNDMSLLLGDYHISRLTAKVPVLGGRGKLLEYGVFNAIYNVPLALRTTLVELQGRI